MATVEEPQQEQAAEEGAPEEQSTGRLQRLGRLKQTVAEHRLMTALVGGGVLVGAIGMVLVGMFFFASDDEQPVTLEETLAMLDAGLYSEAHLLGKRLKTEGELPIDSFGAPSFVMGAALAYEADRAFTQDKKSYYLLSSRHLEQARDLGLPPDRRGEGLFLLGRTLFLSGQIPASRPVFEEALVAAPRHRSEILWLLTEAHLSDANPQYDEALASNEKYLADRVLRPADRQRGLAQRARILLGLNRREECLATLAEIPEEAKDQAEALVIKARVILAEADELLAGDGVDIEQEKDAWKRYDEAIDVLKSAQGRDTLSTQASRKAMYLTAICLLRQREFTKALEQFAYTSRSNPETAESLAANFEMAELLRMLGNHRESLAAYGRALSQVPGPSDYSNQWIALNDLQRRTVKAYEFYLAQETFDWALLLTESMHPLLPMPRVIELKAIAQATWGRRLLETAQSLEFKSLTTQLASGREHLRRAGDAYTKLAKLRIVTDHYSEDMWNASQCYLQGHDFTHAVILLQDYLNNGSRQRHPQALVDLGEAQLNLGRMDGALAAFEECIEFHPRDAAAYRARLIASQTHAEKGEMAQAEALLDDNLNGHLSPDSLEWRDSLFALGNLFYRQHRYESAIERLDEAVRRYPDCRQTLPAQYMIAECYRARATEVRERIAADLVESVRKTNLRKVYTYLTSAAELYAEVQKSLNRRQEEQQLTEVERKTLRNCYFAIGATWFDLGDYDTAIRAYSVASTHYQNSPESLEAYVQIARSYRRKSNPDEARATLRRGQEVLKRLEQRDDFLQVTNCDAQQWAELLNWMSTL